VCGRCDDHRQRRGNSRASAATTELKCQGVEERHKNFSESISGRDGWLSGRSPQSSQAGRSLPRAPATVQVINPDLQRMPGATPTA
jgi:hypothetical protein